jgi:hypothetical protein
MFNSVRMNRGEKVAHVLKVVMAGFKRPERHTPQVASSVEANERCLKLRLFSAEHQALQRSNMYGPLPKGESI